jgi:GTP pyrophosphokinase
LLRDVSNVLADEGVNVEKVNTNSNKRSLQVNMEIRIAVPGLPTLSRVMNRLEQLPNVTSVVRMN